MGKVIFWLVVFFAVLLVLRLVNTAAARGKAKRQGSDPGRDGTMIQCVDCGIYLPNADAKRGPQGPLCGDPQCAKRREQARPDR